MMTISKLHNFRISLPAAMPGSLAVAMRFRNSEILKFQNATRTPALIRRGGPTVRSGVRPVS
jgi:hypothetical protein